MDNRHIDDEYCKIGQELIDTQSELDYIKVSNATIIFLSSDYEKRSNKKKIYGQCEKVADKYKWGIPCDFTITVFEPNVEGFTKEQIKILLFHELLHVGIDFTDDGEKYYINPHDLEDFKTIIDLYGTNWSEV